MATQYRGTVKWCLATTHVQNHNQIIHEDALRSSVPADLDELFEKKMNVSWSLKKQGNSHQLMDIIKTLITKAEPDAGE